MATKRKATRGLHWNATWGLLDTRSAQEGWPESPHRPSLLSWPVRLSLTLLFLNPFFLVYPLGWRHSHSIVKTVEWDFWFYVIVRSNKALRHTAEEEERAHPHLTTSLIGLPEMFTKSMPSRRDVIKRLALPPIGRETNYRVGVSLLFYSIIKIFSSSCLIFRISGLDSPSRYMYHCNCYTFYGAVFHVEREERYTSARCNYRESR